MKKSTRVPEPMQDKFNNICAETDKFCDKYLNKEYRELIHAAVAALARKRPSPLTKGREITWAAGVINAVGGANFLFDKSQTPHCKASDISTFFAVAASTMQNKSKEIRDLLKIDYFSPEWTLPSKIESNSAVWLVQVNGFIVDIRSMPLDVQEVAFQKGLIPYVPGNRQTE
jgi:hypothetical protein